MTDYTGPFDGTRPNSQPIQKKSKPHRPDVLQVHSIFFTIQGEGPFAGVPAVFVRLAGCNLQCPMCDTEYTDGIRELSPADILKEIMFIPLRDNGLVVITGGEPFRQNLSDLFRAIVDAGFYAQVETNGTLPPPEWELGYSLNPSARQGVYIVCSPKTGKVHKDVRYRACCFKYVVSAEAMDPEDGLPTSVLGLPNPAAKPDVGRDGRFTKPVYIQPADHQNERINHRNMVAAAGAAMTHGYTLQLQIHKYLGLE